MKLITDKNTNGLTSKEFTEFLKTPTPYSTFTKEEAEELEQTLKKGLETYPGLGILQPNWELKREHVILSLEMM